MGGGLLNLVSYGNQNLILNLSHSAFKVAMSQCCKIASLCKVAGLQGCKDVGTHARPLKEPNALC